MALRTRPDGRSNGSRLMLRPLRPQQIVGWRKTNFPILVCPRLQHRLYPPGQAFAKSAPITCASAARHQLFRTPTKFGCFMVFELFNSLRSRVAAEVIEVYPYAIIRALLPACEHKSTERGYRD